MAIPAKIWAPITLAALAAVVGGSLASAHNQVVRTQPANGEEWAESPVTIEVETYEGLLNLGDNSSAFAIVVMDQSGRYYGDGCVSVGEKMLSATVELGEAGPYEVIYQLVSEDGHTISDRFGFSFTPHSGHSPTLGASEPPVCGEEIITAEPLEVTPTPDQPVAAQVDEREDDPAAASEPGPGVGTIVAGALGTVTIGAATWWLLRRRLKS